MSERKVYAPPGCLQCQCEVFSPDRGGLAMRSVVSYVEERSYYGSSRHLISEDIKIL